MTQIFIKVPFALSGDKLAIPEAVQPGGEASFTQGYGPKYSEDPATTGLRLDREQSNQLFYILSTDINQYQTESFPRFISTADNGGVAYSYSKFATVLYDAGSGLEVYQSLVAANTALPTDATKWRLLDPYNRLIERASPAFTGTPTAPTATVGNNTTQIATTAFVAAAVAAIVPSNPKILAQVVFDGDGGTSIKSSFNVSGVVRESAGFYTINFTTALPNSNYGVQISNLSEFGGNNGSVYSSAGFSGAPSLKNQTQLRICTGNGVNRTDNGYITVTIIG